MFQNITSNYLYLLITVIILFYVYFTVQMPTKTHFPLNNITLIKINEDIIQVDTNNIYSHLLLIKENLYTIQKSNFTYDIDIISRVQQLINLSCNDLHAFAIANNYIANYKQHMQSETSKLNLHCIITDLETTLLLLTKNTHGHLTLTHLHQLLKMFTTITHGNNYLTYDELFDLDTTLSNNQEEFRKYGKLNNSYIHKQCVSKHTDVSQNILHGYNNNVNDGEIFVNDETNILFENRIAKRKEKRDNYVNYNTQMFGTSGNMYTDKRNANKHFVPFCNINKLKQENIQHKVFVDKHARQSLRNDYNL